MSGGLIKLGLLKYYFLPYVVFVDEVNGSTWVRMGAKDFQAVSAVRRGRALLLASAMATYISNQFCACARQMSGSNNVSGLVSMVETRRLVSSGTGISQLGQKWKSST